MDIQPIKEQIDVIAYALAAVVIVGLALTIWWGAFVAIASPS